MRQAILIGLFLLGLVVAGSAQAATVTTENTNGTWGLANPYLCASSDLISGLTPVQTGYILHWGPWQNDPSRLNDNATYPATLTNASWQDPADYGWANSLTFPNFGGGSDAVSSVTYTLAGASTITGIAVFGGWPDNTSDTQNWKVSYSTDGIAFTDLQSVNYNPVGVPDGGGNLSVTKVSSTDATGILASNVTDIRFTFYGGYANGGGAYGELDVLGYSNTTPVPAPAGLALLGLGSMGLAFIRRRKAQKA